jgi:SAM-dependent methyltransferase
MPIADIKWEWEERGARYRETIASGPSSSSWLRDTVLKPEIVRLLGDRSNSRVLDAGTGSGWLFDAVAMRERHACDIVQPLHVRPDVTFVQANVARLHYPNNHFDAVVASIVLCYCENLGGAAAELCRVTAPGGTLIVALVHPYFYRTGEALSDDRYIIEADLSRSERQDIVIGETAGPFSYFRYPLSAYVNALTRAGWRLDQMSELYIPRAEYEAQFRGNDIVQRSTRVPLFLTMALTKP